MGIAGDGEVILITGGSGCLGQHIIRELQERDTSLIREIRVVDKEPFENRISYNEKIPVIPTIGDICSPNEIKSAFKDVNVVFHCAAYMSFSYPTDTSGLERTNVEGTQNIINLCIENNVEYLIYTSDLFITIVPFSTPPIFSVCCYETESKAQIPTTDDKFLIPGYPASKLRAEKLILEAHGKPLSNEQGVLKTVSARIPVMYGEADQTYISKIIEFAQTRNGIIPKLAGDGGKHQLLYAGNAAWGHVCIKNSLKQDAERVGGLPVTITDESPIFDIGRFVNVMLARYSENVKVQLSSWKISLMVTYFFAMILQFFVLLLHKLTGFRMKYSPCAILSYWGSFLFWSRLRASIHADYDPVYTAEVAMEKSGKWYDKWYTEKQNKKSN